MWAACLTVAEYFDSESTYLGYIPNLAPDEGGLTSTSFTYGDTSLTIENLYYQETAGGDRHLVLELDAPLRDEMILHAGNTEFPLLLRRAPDLARTLAPGCLIAAWVGLRASPTWWCCGKLSKCP